MRLIFIINNINQGISMLDSTLKFNINALMQQAFRGELTT